MENKALKTTIIVMSLLFAVYAYFNNPFTLSAPPLSGNEICMDYSKDKPATLKHSLVSEMIKNYRDNQLVSIQTATANPVPNDAQSIWFHLDSIKKFIYHIEKGFETQKPGAKGDLGLRIYYAAYPKETLWGTKGYEDIADLANDPTTAQYGKKHTLVMIPTLEIHGVNSDFNPIDPATYTGFNSPTNPFSNPNYVPMAMSSSVMAKNHGSLCPPALSTGNAF
jgi:hypothetical protein